MNHLTILIPFALPPAAMGPDLLRSMQTPALALLLGRSQLDLKQEFDAFSLALPHERWLAKSAGYDTDAFGSSPPVAAQSLARFEPMRDAATWFVLNPIHLHIARDHLVLTDPRRLELDDAASQQLFALAQPIFDEYGHSVVYGNATNWFLRADTWHDLRTATPDAACGHNIDIWMPTGTAERAWRKLQNEVQMHWHDAAVNQRRQSLGKNPVNALWLWGGAPTDTKPPSPRYQKAFMPTSTMAYFGVMADDACTVSDAATVIASCTTDTLLVLDTLIEPALGDDLGEWLTRINAMETTWFGPLLTAIKSGAVHQYRFILTNSTSLREQSVSRNALRKFWQTPSLSALLA